MSPRPQAESSCPRGPDGSWIGVLLLLVLPTQAAWKGRALLDLMLIAAQWRHPAGTDSRCFMSRSEAADPGSSEPFPWEMEHALALPKLVLTPRVPPATGKGAAPMSSGTKQEFFGSSW